MKKFLWPGLGLLCAILVTTAIVRTVVPERLDTRPDVTLRIIDGTSIQLASVKDGPLLVNFWATTCTICMQELPRMIALYQDLASDGLHMVSIAMPYDPPNFVLDTVKQFQIPYPVALDIEGHALQAFKYVKATPTMFLIAPDGKVFRQYTGKTDFDQLRRDITDLM